MSGLTIDRRHGTEYWYMRGTVRGQRVDESTRTKSKGEAQAICTRRERQIEKEHDEGPRATARFVTAANDYREVAKDDRFIDKLQDYFGDWVLSDIDQAAVDAFIRKECPKLKTPSAINRQVFTPLSAILNYASLSKLCDAPKFKRRKLGQDRIRWLKPEEAMRLRAACAKHLRPLVTFLLYTGCRAGEAMALDWREVDLEARTAVFLVTKNGKPRPAPLVPVVLEALQALPHRTGKVFLTDEGRPYAVKLQSGGQFKSAFKSACVRAGIENFHPHDCRHTWATWHFKANGNLRELMELGGWKTMSMVTRYAHNNSDTLEAGALKLPGSTSSAA